MCSLVYDFFVIFIAVVCLLWLLAWGVVPIGTWVNCDSLLLDRDLTQKLHNNLYNVDNNNNNVLKTVQKVHQLYTRHVVQLVAGGLTSGKLL